MKRLIIFTALLILTTVSFSQQTGIAPSNNAYARHFGQCMLNLSSEEEYVSLELSLKNNPNVAVVRLDRISQRAFILTNDLGSLTSENFRSWFGEYSERISCIQVGKHDVDPIAPFPFTNCQD